MASIPFMENHQVVNLVVPVADVFAGDKTTPEVKMDKWDHCTFLVVTGANASGDEPMFVVESCSTAAGANNTAIPFQYSYTPNGESEAHRGTWYAYAATATTGIQTNPTSAKNLMHVIDFDAADLSSTSGVHHEYARLVVTESGSSGITGCVLAILSNPRYATDADGHPDVAS
jgi:hypothetical protein